MKAAFISIKGKTNEVLQIGDLPVPTPQPDEILVQIRSAALNPVDYKVIEGLFPASIKFPYIPSEDFSGVVSKIGSNVTRFKEGDEVFGKNYVSMGGAIAQYLSIKESLVVKKPKNVNFDEAAGFPLAGLTAYQALKVHAKATAGNKVLILGGSGGVGSLAIQLAKYFGTFVSTTSSGKNSQLMKELGADLVIDYTKENWGELLKDQNYDIIFDTAGGEKHWEFAQQVLKNGGDFVTIVQHKAQFESSKGIKFIPFLTQENLEHLGELAKIIESGKVKSLIAQTFPLEKALDAFELSKTHRAVGKVVVKLS